MAASPAGGGTVRYTEHHKVIKLALLGDKQVGKTSLISRYVHDSFSPHYYYTQGADQVDKYITINDNRVLVKFFDLAGHKYARSLIKSLYRDVQGILVVLDVTRETTFTSVQEWIRQIELVNNNSPVIFLVGNKLDLTSHRSVPEQLSSMQSRELGLPYMETSAKTGENVAETFDALLRVVWHSLTPRIISPSTIVISAHKDTIDGDSCCCIT